jgi:type IV secretory pathway VirJ component
MEIGRCPLLLAAFLVTSLAYSAGPTEAPDAGTSDNISSITDLPLVEVPASAGQTNIMAVMVSGDGGWASLVEQVAGVLASNGIPVVGLNSLKYYWQPHSPDESAQALTRILRHYLAEWGKTRILLIGYSRGADVLPFMASRLAEDLASRVDLIALLGPATTITFQFRVSDWLVKQRSDGLPVQPEIEKLRGKTILCIYGVDESDTVCPQLPAGLAILDKRPGAHHFNADYQSVADRIVTEAGR